MTSSNTTGLRPAVLPAIERVHFTDPTAARAWEQLRSVIETRFGAGGRKLDKAVTWHDLVQAGLANMRLPDGRLIRGKVGGEFVPAAMAAIDSAPPDGIPPAPTGLVVTPALATVMLEWDKPAFAHYGYAELWRASTNNLAQAVMVGQTTAWVYADPLQSGDEVTYWYWIRFISAGGKQGPFNAVSGTSGAWEPPDAVPPAPTGLATTDALAAILLQWDDPAFEYYGHAEVWRADSNVRDLAEKIGQSNGWGYTDHINEAAGASWWYWIRFVSRGGKTGPWHGLDGVQGSVSADPQYLLDILNGKITTGQFAQGVIEGISDATLAELFSTHPLIEDLSDPPAAHRHPPIPPSARLPRCKPNCRAILRWWMPRPQPPSTRAAPTPIKSVQWRRSLAAILPQWIRKPRRRSIKPAPMRRNWVRLPRRRKAIALPSSPSRTRGWPGTRPMPHNCQPWWRGCPLAPASWQPRPV